MKYLVLCCFLWLANGLFGQNCLFYSDLDGDGYGDPNVFITADCNAVISAYVQNDLDCDDTNALVNPAAVEICNYIDDNCNGGEIDEFVLNNYYQDSDGDGYGDANFVAYDCVLPMGFVENMDDCDDNLITYIDADGDGFGSDVMEPCGVSNNLDCNDNSIGIQDSTIYYQDLDQDGYGNPAQSIVSCEFVNGYVLVGLDCDDLDLTINPDAMDVMGNGVDENCDGQDGVGISERHNDLVIFPQPARNYVNIIGGLTGDDWMLYDAIGVQVMMGRVSKGGFTILLQGLSPGNYLLRCGEMRFRLVVD
jgi:Putative metal-binding motif